MNPRKLVGLAVLVSLAILCRGAAAAADTAAAACPYAAPAAATVGPAPLFLAAPAAALGSPAWGMPPATALCVQGFCNTNAQCTCPGSTCVGHVCTTGSGGGGGGGGGCTLHTFCSTDAACTGCPGWTCVDNVCQAP